MPAPSTRNATRLRAALTAAVFLAAVIGLEVVTRRLLMPASNDLRSFGGYPARAAELDAADGLRVAIFGNSTARSGVDGARLGELMTEHLGRPVEARLFVADSAEVSTWYFMMRRYFWRPRRRADLTVLLFYGDGLEDAREPDLGRLAQFFTTPADLPELFRDHVRGAERQLEYLASSFWMTFAARDRLRERALKAFVPDHAAYARRLNDWEYARRPPRRPPIPSYRKLEKLLAEARLQGGRIVVVALPTAPFRAYEIPDALVATIERAGMTFLDDRKVSGITPDLLPDGLHLADTGKEIYTRVLADELSRVVAGDSAVAEGRAD